jgi:hypothetical protein
MIADLACAIADGAEVISDFRVMGDQDELFGLVASAPACWRALSEIAAGGQPDTGAGHPGGGYGPPPGVGRGAARHGALPGVRVADWAERHDSLLVLTWDEDDGSQANHITTTFAGRGCSPAARPSRSPTTVLATLEAAYTLPRDARASTVAPTTNIWLP